MYSAVQIKAANQSLNNPIYIYTILKKVWHVEQSSLGITALPQYSNK